MQELEDDSDEAEMKRIMKMDEEDEVDGDDEGGEDENMEEDSNLQESSNEQDEDVASSGQSSLSSSKKVLKKRNLKDRVREEEVIRAKEKRMRSTTD